MAEKAAIVPKTEIVKIHIKVTLNTTDGLRRVSFELEKDTDDNGAVSWKITFSLFEREKKSDAFGDAIVDLEVDVDTKLNAKAAAMANDGITASQAAFALGPAADTAKDNDASDAMKAQTVQNTLKK